MRKFFSNRDMRQYRKRLTITIVSVALIIGLYYIINRPRKPAPDLPTVVVEPVERDDVEIYGE